MYQLYHIKGIKWGCSKNLVKRLKQQGYSLVDVCEIVEESNIDIASELEKEWNIRDGYSWNDSQDYRRVKKMASIGGKATSANPINVNNFKKVASKNAVANSLKSRYKLQKVVLQYDLDGNFIKEWPGVRYVKTHTNICCSKCVRGLKKTAGGYIWKFKY